MVKARVKKPNPLHKPWVSARKEPLLPSAKIRSRWRSYQIFGVTVLELSSGAMCYAREGLDFPSLVSSMLAQLLLERYLLDCC